MPPDDSQGSDACCDEFARSETGRPVRRRRFNLILLIAAMIALGVGIYAGIHMRAEADTKLAIVTDAAAVPVVNVTSPQAAAADQSLVLPGSTVAFTDTPIYARTNGYLKRWYFDIGAHVKQGQLLAEIETPEVDQQLRQARADLATVTANLGLARITAQRNEDLLKSRSVSTQDRDNAVGAYNADKAIVDSRQADVARLEQMQSYEKVFAPFDGIITARNTDIGALIDAGATSQLRELFHLAATDTLRIFVAVPEVYSTAMQAGAAIAVTLDEFPDETFHGTLVRTSNAIDATSRTLLVEVDVDNSSGRLLPGAYVSVHFSLPAQGRSVAIPANTLLFRSEGLQVAVVRDGKAELVPIKIGRDHGDTVEVVAGLKSSDEVILDPSDSLVSDTPVRVNGGAAVGSAR
jgi:RND family efflux transporter MFP subunit